MTQAGHDVIREIADHQRAALQKIPGSGNARRSFGREAAREKRTMPATLDEISARLDRHASELDDLRHRITLAEAQDNVTDVHRINVEKRLGDIEDTLKWMVRLIVGAILLAIIGYAMQNGAAINGIPS